MHQNTRLVAPAVPEDIQVKAISDYQALKVQLPDNEVILLLTVFTPHNRQGLEKSGLSAEKRSVY